VSDDVRGPLRSGVEFIERAHAILETETARLAPLLPSHELVLVGGSCLAGTLTTGDVDLHLRVRPADFTDVVTVLRGIYPVVHPEIWQASLATFSVRTELPAGLAVTPAGSEHDVRFTRSWRLLATDPELLGAYNAMKVDYHGRSSDEYSRAKSAFFDMLVGLEDL
jgi:hypothetical protein